MSRWSGPRWPKTARTPCAGSWSTLTGLASRPTRSSTSCRCERPSRVSWCCRTCVRRPLSALNEARFGILFGAVGAAMACYEAAVEYARVREQFGRPIGGFQLTQNKLVDALQAITQAQLLAYQLGRLKDSGTLRPQQVSLGKRANVSMALEVARSMRSVLGANGISLEHPIFRHMVNLESVSTYEGTHEIHTLVVGNDITGISAYAS